MKRMKISAANENKMNEVLSFTLSPIFLRQFFIKEKSFTIQTNFRQLLIKIFLQTIIYREKNEENFLFNFRQLHFSSQRL